MYHVDNKDFDEKDELKKENNFILNLDIDGFNGPLDLLLQLAQTKKLDITKISILELVDQYLSFIKKAKTVSNKNSISASIPEEDIPQNVIVEETKQDEEISTDEEDKNQLSEDEGNESSENSEEN